MASLIEQPGLLFVIATLLPLFSFTLLIVWGAIRWALRPYAKTNSGVNNLFQTLGGEVTGYGPALVALTAIALAFVCSLTGFIWLYADLHEKDRLQKLISPQSAKAGHGHGHDHNHKDEEAKQPALDPKDAKAQKIAKQKEEEIKAARTRVNVINERWHGHKWPWAQIKPSQS